MKFIIYLIGVIAFIYIYKSTNPRKYRYKKRKYDRINYIKLTENSKLTEKQRYYRDYLQSNHWKETRARALQRANYKCEKCSYTEQLQVHHLNYNNLWHEHDEDLLVVCRKCHAKIHHKI